MRRLPPACQDRESCITETTRRQRVARIRTFGESPMVTKAHRCKMGKLLIRNVLTPGLGFEGNMAPSFTADAGAEVSCCYPTSPCVHCCSLVTPGSNKIWPDLIWWGF